MKIFLKFIIITALLSTFYIYAGNKTNNTQNSTEKSDNIEPKDIKGITKAHNVIRRKLGISTLQWSNKLANYAQIWANHLKETNNCNMKHRPHYGKYKQKYVENLHWASATIWSNGKREIQKETPSQAIQGWIDEAKNYHYSTNKCDSGKICGHYTQVIWAKSKKVGCAKAICSDKSQIWVCNYSPAGNYVGEKPY